MLKSPEFSVRTRSLDGYCVVSAYGELDMFTAPQLEEALAGSSDGVPVVVDLRKVTFLASHGIRVLLKERSGRRPVLVVEPGSQIMRLFDIVDPTHNVPLFPSVKAAIEGATKGSS
jgi:anti-anti-sigma factor